MTAVRRTRRGRSIARVYADRSRTELIGSIEGQAQTIDAQRATIGTLEAKAAALDYRLTQMQRRRRGSRCRCRR